MRTVYYDIETTSQFAPYTQLTLVGLLWDDDKVEVFEYPFKEGVEEYLRKLFADPNLIKVGYNNCNFDDLVLFRYGLPVNEINRHDAMLAVKTTNPELPSFSLKFLNWLLFGDFHWAEYELLIYQQYHKKKKFDEAPARLLEPYNIHDLFQHRNIWLWVQNKLVGRSKEAYELDISQGYVIRQMILEGGLHIDLPRCEKLIKHLNIAKERNEKRVAKLTDNKVRNSGSNKQVGAYLDEEGFELELTENNSFVINKDVIKDLVRLHPIGRCVRISRKVNSILKYVNNYVLAAKNHPEGWIPTSYSISGARTRRYTSSSQFKINFQNPSEIARSVQLVPDSWLGGWIDSSQIENVVHIYESNDHERRLAYEADENWSEYVWLCNKVLGTNLTKKQLDSIKSPQNENWTVYKQYKTVKLMMNFGSGSTRFAKVTGFPPDVAKKLYMDIQRACPAIKGLQSKIERAMSLRGEVYDVFGHLYRGSAAYKLVAYLVQGCGTGSLPKAQLRANYNTFERYNKMYGRNVALLCATTHDETAFRIDLSIGDDAIESILKELMFNMTKMFEPKFDNIPLRAKLYLSRTTNTNRIECPSYASFNESRNQK